MPKTTSNKFIETVTTYYHYLFGHPPTHKINKVLNELQELQVFKQFIRNIDSKFTPNLQTNKQENNDSKTTEDNSTESSEKYLKHKHDWLIRYALLETFLKSERTYNTMKQFGTPLKSPTEYTTRTSLHANQAGLINILIDAEKKINSLSPVQKEQLRTFMSTKIYNTIKESLVKKYHNLDNIGIHGHLMRKNLIEGLLNDTESQSLTFTKLNLEVNELTSKITDLSSSEQINKSVILNHFLKFQNIIKTTNTLKYLFEHYFSLFSDSINKLPDTTTSDNTDNLKDSNATEIKSKSDKDAFIERYNSLNQQIINNINEELDEYINKISKQSNAKISKQSKAKKELIDGKINVANALKEFIVDRDYQKLNAVKQANSNWDAGFFSKLKKFNHSTIKYAEIDPFSKPGSNKQ